MNKNLTKLINSYYLYNLILMDEKKYKYQHSQLLQIIYDAHKNNLITQDEKIKIKGNPI